MKKTTGKLLRLVPLVIILTATIGAGIADVAFSDVTPIRPYTSLFRYTPVWQTVHNASSIIGNIMIASLVILLISSLLVAVANRTTGIIIAHTGGPPVNTNLTGSPGTTSVIPLFPLILGFVGLFAVAKYLRVGETAGV
jgi:hypothetical protein